MTAEARPQIAILFKGQGIHFVGMERQVLEYSAAARKVFDRVEDAIGFSLREKMTNPAKLDNYAQLATVTTEIAQWEALKEHIGGLTEYIRKFFGSSLGQFPAYYASGAVNLEHLAVLVHKRNQLTKQAQEKRPGSMMAVIGMAEDDLTGVLSEGKDIYIGNHNFPTSHVISGDIQDPDLMMDKLKRKNAKLVSPLSGIPYASHSPLMEEVSAEMGEAIEATPFSDTAGNAVYPNETAEPTGTGSVLKGLLPRHLTDPVLLDQTFARLTTEGRHLVVEIGPGEKAIFVRQMGKIYEGLQGLHLGEIVDLAAVGEKIKQHVGAV